MSEYLSYWVGQIVLWTLGFGGIAGFTLLITGFYRIVHKSVGVIERFGKFHRITQPGLHWRIPLVDTIRDRLSLRIHELSVQAETKTKDNVFVTFDVAVQYFTKPDDDSVLRAEYELANPAQQIRRSACFR